MKHGLFTANIYYYIMTEFDYAKCDYHLAQYGRGLQRFQFIKVCAGKNNIRHYNCNFDIYAITSDTISVSAECYAGLSVRFESSAACI